MALGSDLKNKQQTAEDIEEVLDGLEKLLERTKVMFEQYFMGIQKVAPSQLHRDVERKVRELTQHQIRNTGLRFRFQTLSQKFGAYNTYWKRTMREIEQGRYVRDLARVTRKAVESGEDLPEEMLAKLPKLVQDRIRRDRARMAQRLKRDASGAPIAADAPSVPEDQAAAPAHRPNVHEISEDEAGSLFGDGDLDMDNLFGAMMGEKPEAPPPAAPAPQPPPQVTVRVPVVQPPAAAIRMDPAGIIPRSAPKVGGQPPKPTGAPMPMTTRVPVVPPPIPSARKPAVPAAPAPAPAPAPSPPPAPPPGMTEKQCRELHARYVKARELVGEKEPVAYDKLVSTLGRQAPAIMKEHGARGVEYQVIVRGEKVILKAKPIK